MKYKAFAVILLLALANATSAQTPAPAPNAPAVPLVKQGSAALAADRLPSSDDPRVCLEFPTTAQVIACAEKYRPRKRSA
jgi:hypothetical protein